MQRQGHTEGRNDILPDFPAQHKQVLLNARGNETNQKTQQQTWVYGRGTMRQLRTPGVCSKVWSSVPPKTRVVRGALCGGHPPVLCVRMERPALFVGDAEGGAATLNEGEVRGVFFP